MATPGETILAAIDASIRAYPQATSMLFERARALEMSGNDVEAELAYRAVLAVDPQHFRAHNDLGLLYNRHGLPADALQCFIAAVAADERNATGHANLGAMLLAAGEVTTAKAEFEAALALRPDHPGALDGRRAVHAHLGLPPPPEPIVAHSAAATATTTATPAPDPFVEYVFEVAVNAIVAGQGNAARTFVRFIARSDARFVPLLRRLADAAGSQRDFATARALFDRALELDPRDPELHLGRAIVLEEMGDPAAGAAWSHDRVRGAIRLFPYTGSGDPVRVLTIASALHAIRYEIFCTTRAMQNTVLYTQAYAPGEPLPAHDVVLVAVADVESDGPALAVARTIVERTHAPVVNHPDRVRQTGRIEQARRLATIPGVTTAPAMSFAREALLAGGAPAMLRVHGYAFPLLLRSPGFHNGRFFEMVDDETGLARSAAAMPGDDLLAIAYRDTRSPDGMVRKYRVMSIDGRLYPVHMAISHHWKVHYVSSAMAFDEALRAEEARYLADMHAVLGTPAVDALEAVAEAMALDYGGIDFGLMPDGTVAVFEANAAMAIFVPDADPRWDYRRAAMSRAIDAATNMIVTRGTAARQVGSMGSEKS